MFYNYYLWLVQNDPELLVLGLLTLDVRVALAHTERHGPIGDIHLTEAIQYSLLHVAVDDILEEPCSFRNSLIDRLDDEPDVSVTSDDLPRLQPSGVEEGIDGEGGRGKEVVGEELVAVDAETQQVAVRQTHDEVRGIWGGRRMMVFSSQ